MIIDELDKANSGVTDVLYSALESEKIFIAKADLNISLNTRISFLAAANPVLSKWNPNLSKQANLGLPQARAQIRKIDL